MNGNVAEMETFFLALADKTRLRIINLIGDGEVCVCFFTETLEELQPKISRHLAYLRRAGFVKTRRDGKWIYYRLAEPKDEAASRILSEIQAWMATDGQMQKDRERLAQIYAGPEKMPISIQPLTQLPQIPTQNAESEPYEVKELEDFML
jgi:ArsR family transcriptional regulator